MFYKKRLVIGIIFIVLLNVLLLIGFYLIGKMINEMVVVNNGFNIDFNEVFLLGGLMIFFYLILVFMNYILSVVLVKMF